MLIRSSISTQRAGRNNLTGPKEYTRRRGKRRRVLGRYDIAQRRRERLFLVGRSFLGRGFGGFGGRRLLLRLEQCRGLLGRPLRRVGRLLRRALGLGDQLA